MGSNERRERERQETRTKILDAARELFAAHGFEAVTMRKIAEKIEYTPAAIYFHFKDKDELIRELCANDFLSFGQKFQVAASEADPIARLLASADVYIEFALTHPNSYRIMFMNPTPPNLEEPEWAGNPANDAYAFLKIMVGEAIEKGLLRPELDDAELVSQVIWAGLHGVVSLEIAMCNDEMIDWRDVQARARTMTDVLMRGIARTPPDLRAPPRGPAPKTGKKKTKK